MSGMSNRFLEEGYDVPKFLIKIHGKYVIEHVINLYPNNCKFSVIINDHHSKTTNIIEILENLNLNLSVYIIEKHKLGPAYAISKIFDKIEDNENVVVNYCDFSMDWRYEDFNKFVKNTNVEGCIITYTGFHPHMLHGSNYAFCKINENNDLIQIKEKESFTSDKMSEHASTGTYYFKSGELLKKYITHLIENDISINGEFYISLAYNKLVEDKLTCKVFEIKHMLQWGTPFDLKEYLYWSDIFEKLSTYSNNFELKNYMTILPMAGEGQRFSRNGFKIHKPLLPINNYNMFEQAIKCLPKTNSTYLGVLKDKDIFDTAYNKIVIDKLLPGQACTVEKMINNIFSPNPLLVSSCDNGVLIDFEKLKNLIDDNVDIIVWTYKNSYSNIHNPDMYSWVNVDNNENITSVDVKNFGNRGNPMEHLSIVGTFLFKNSEVFLNSINKLYKSETKTNGEYYIDNLINSSIELGYKVKNFQVDNYICWGTPNDYKTFNYWQSFFDGFELHPYQINQCFFSKK